MKKLLLFSLLALSALSSLAAMDSEEHTTSYIYYPHGIQTMGGNPVGHAELEANGTVYNSNNPSRELAAMVYKSTRDDGRPFFRFVFNATTNQINDMHKIIGHRNNGLTCSTIALAPLHETEICSIPLPLRLSPLLSAAYFTGRKLSGCKNIKTIEFYGNPSKRKNALAIIPGILGESFLIGLFLWGSYTTLKIAWLVNTLPHDMIE